MKMSDRSLFSVSRRVVVLRLGATALGLAVLTGAPACASGAKDKNIVYKTPTCGCCTAWTEHLKGAGFDFRIVEVDDDVAHRRAVRLGYLTAYHHTLRRRIPTTWRPHR